MNCLIESFKNYYVTPLKEYATFDGRTKRKNFWLFIAFNFIIGWIFSLIDHALDTTFLYTIYSLLVLIPSLAIIFRRLHDIGKAGTWILLAFIPIIGEIWLLILLCSKSEEFDNKYGTYIKN